MYVESGQRKSMAVSNLAVGSYLPCLYNALPDHRCCCYFFSGCGKSDIALFGPRRSPAQPQALPPADANSRAAWLFLN